MVRGITIAAGGFFGPQGRELRIPLADPEQNEKIEKFEYNDYRITNFEMESSALAGLARLMGHKAMTVCIVIANRLIKEANTGYKNSIDGLIEKSWKEYNSQFSCLYNMDKFTGSSINTYSYYHPEEDWHKQIFTE